MAKKKVVITQNYLERIPFRPVEIKWKEDGDGIVTLEIENKGFMNRVAQKLFKKPRVSYIHLDKMGSFIWHIMDGEKTVIDLGKDVDARFGEECHPLYERLAQYLRILDSYGFVRWANK